MNALKILKRPIVTEKSTLLQESGKYVFEVDMHASKGQVARAIEETFGVTVRAVNTAKVRGKVKRYGRRATKQPDWKKAVVSLSPGETITLFEGA